MTRFRTLLAILAVALSVVVAAFLIWAYTPASPMAEAYAALQPDPTVSVRTDRWLEFSPAKGVPDTGLIFYQGGRVDARVYAPPARRIAQEGYLVVIIPMPLNLAVTNPNAAQEVITAYPSIQRWIIGGHSLGGSMAASFARRHPSLVAGLVLWASYPAGSDDLSTSDLSVLSIYGSLDGLATPAKIEASRPLLPPNTTFVAIQGGNHAQFGWYGEQSGDNPASITRQAQQAQVVQSTLAFLTGIY